MFLEKELSSELMKSFYDIRNKYGRWHKEIIFDRALQEYYNAAKIKFIPQPKIKIHSIDTGRILGTYIPDLLVENKILIETKAKDFITKDEYGRATSYLKCCEYEILYIVNFKEEFFKPRRFIYTNDRKQFIIKRGAGVKQ